MRNVWPISQNKCIISVEGFDYENLSAAASGIDSLITSAGVIAANVCTVRFGDAR